LPYPIPYRKALETQAAAAVVRDQKIYCPR
jgi:hypothetical protein